MPSSGLLLRVALVRTDVSEEPSASIIMATKTSELGALAVTNNPKSISSRRAGRLLITAKFLVHRLSP
jgi:hypothetical protein